MAYTEEIELNPIPDPASPSQSAPSARLRRRRSPFASEQTPGRGLQTGRVDFLTWLSSQWNKRQDFDELERDLQLFVASNPASQRLLDAYSRFKDQPSGELFKALLAFRTYSPRETSASSYQSLEVEDSTTFTSCLSALKESLINEDPVVLLVCVLRNNVSKYIRSNRYSFTSDMFASTEFQEAKRNAPIRALLKVIQREWRLRDEVMADCDAGSRLPKPTFIDLPSEHNVQPFTLSSLKGKSFSLQWLRDITSYAQDLSVYVWQPHLEPLDMLSAFIYISPDASISGLEANISSPEANSSHHHTALLVLKCSKFVEPLPLPLPTMEWLQDRVLSDIGEVFNKEAGLVLIILFLYSILIVDTSFFINSIFEEIEKLSIEGRRNPSVSKIHYTLYLTDCQKTSAQALQNAAALLISISDYIASQNMAPSFVKWNGTIEKDLEYLESRLSVVNTKVEELRLSGFFGMNISDPLWITPGNGTASSPNATASSKANNLYGSVASNQKLLNLVNETVPGTNDSTVELPLLTSEIDAIVAAITTSGPHLFSFQTFLIVAFIVTISTIVLPLLAGAIFRTALQSIDRYKGYWRVLILLFGIAAIVITNIFLDVAIYVLIFGLPQGLFAIVKLLEPPSILMRKRWIAYAALLSMSISFDLVRNYSLAGLTGILPFVYLFLLGFVSDVKVFMRNRVPQLLQWLRTGRIINTHYKYSIWATILVWIGINIGLFFSINASFALLMGYGIFIVLYGVGKLQAAIRTRESVFEWLGFLAVATGAFVIDFYFSAPILLAALPVAYLIFLGYLHNDQEFMKSYFPNWLVRRERAVFLVSDTGNV